MRVRFRDRPRFRGSGCSAIVVCAAQQNGYAIVSRFAFPRRPPAPALLPGVLTQAVSAGDITVDTAADDRVNNGTCSQRLPVTTGGADAARDCRTGASPS